MRKSLALAIPFCLLSSLAFAQTPQPTPMGGTMSPSPVATPMNGTMSPTPAASSSADTNSAVNMGGDKNANGNGSMVAASALAKGANSFTEGETRSRLESAGLSNVADLKKDDMGIWRGKAMRDGKSVSVGLDYKGNMSAE